MKGLEDMVAADLHAPFHNAVCAAQTTLASCDGRAILELPPYNIQGTASTSALWCTQEGVVVFAWASPAVHLQTTNTVQAPTSFKNAAQLMIPACLHAQGYHFNRGGPWAQICTADPTFAVGHRRCCFRSACQVAVAMAKHLFRLWQPFGYVYALTLGKAGCGACACH